MRDGGGARGVPRRRFHGVLHGRECGEEGGKGQVSGEGISQVCVFCRIRVISVLAITVSMRGLANGMVCGLLVLVIENGESDEDDVCDGEQSEGEFEQAAE